MNIKKISIKKSDENIIYNCEKMNFLVKKKNSISLSHIHPKTEKIFLIKGQIGLIVEEKTQKIKAPVEIEIPPNTPHKITALTDAEMLYYYD